MKKEKPVLWLGRVYEKVHLGKHVKRMSLMIEKATDMDEKTVIRVVEAMETNPLQIILPKENQEEHAKGEVYLTMFEFLDTKKSKGIQVRYLLASLVYENYLNSRTMKLDALNL